MSLSLNIKLTIVRHIDTDMKPYVKRLQDLGFIRLRNGSPTPSDEDAELIELVVEGVKPQQDDDESGVILKMLGMKG